MGSAPNGSTGNTNSVSGFSFFIDSPDEVVLLVDLLPS